MVYRYPIITSSIRSVCCEVAIANRLPHISSRSLIPACLQRSSILIHTWMMPIDVSVTCNGTETAVKVCTADFFDISPIDFHLYQTRSCRCMITAHAAVPLVVFETTAALSIYIVNNIYPWGTGRAISQRRTTILVAMPPTRRARRDP